MSFLLNNIDEILTTPTAIDHINAQILTLAIQGRLIPQNYEDEDGRVLLQKVLKKKVELSKNNPEFKDDQLLIEDVDAPYIIPSNWIWTRLGMVTEHPQYGWTTKASVSGDLLYLRTTDISAGLINWRTVPYCEENPPDIDKYLVKDGDILISRAGSIGVSILITDSKPAVFASYLIRFRPILVSTSTLPN